MCSAEDRAPYMGKIVNLLGHTDRDVRDCARMVIVNCSTEEFEEWQACV